MTTKLKQVSKVGAENVAQDALGRLIGHRRVTITGRGLAGDEMVDLYSAKQAKKQGR